MKLGFFLDNVDNVDGLIKHECHFNLGFLALQIRRLQPELELLYRTFSNKYRVNVAFMKQGRGGLF